jgi:hypothetical protein
MAAGGGPLRLLDQAALDEVHAATRAIGYGEPQRPL